MEKRSALADAERIGIPYESFVNSLEDLLNRPKKRCYRADRTAFICTPADKEKLLLKEPNDLLGYNTRSNRFIKRLVLSIRRHLMDLREGYAWTDDVSRRLENMIEPMERLLDHPVLRSLSGDEECVVLEMLDGEYRRCYLSYETLKYALAEFESEIESGFLEVNWEERDVLVGSFGSEDQWRHNLAKKYYYAPEKYFDPSKFPIRYVALYQSNRFAEKGICYYGVVKKIRRIQRKRIWFSTRRGNGEEWYLLFRVKRWKRLARPIAIQDEGVSAPKYTNLFLLGHAEKSYELFEIRSAQQYRVYRQIKRILSSPPHPSNWEAIYPIEGGKSIALHGRLFDLLDEQGVAMRMLSTEAFLEHPTCYLDDIFECVAKTPTKPQEEEAPLWLKRENEAYFERYGKPYSDD